VVSQTESRDRAAGLYVVDWTAARSIECGPASTVRFILAWPFGAVSIDSSRRRAVGDHQGLTTFACDKPAAALDRLTQWSALALDAELRRVPFEHVDKDCAGGQAAWELADDGIAWTCCRRQRERRHWLGGSGGMHPNAAPPRSGPAVWPQTTGMNHERQGVAAA
jgi:hypothetical protein